METRFFFRLSITKKFAEISPCDKAYGDDNDAEGEIMIFMAELCEQLSLLSVVDFQVGGFGLDDWRTDVATDLAVIIEQFPLFFKTMQAREASVLDFYEQGQQRILHFLPDDQKVTIECQSYSKWNPTPPVVQVDFGKVLQMAADFLSTFIFIVKTKLPNYYKHSLFQNHLRLSQFPGN